MLSLQVAVAAVEQDSNQFWNTYLQDFVNGKEVSEQLTQIPINVDKDSLPLGESAQKQLFNELKSFIQKFNQQVLSGDKEANRIVQFFASKPENLNSLYNDYKSLKAKHYLYLAHFDSTREKLEALNLSNHYEQKIEIAKGTYLQTVGEFFSAMDLLFDALKREENGEKISLIEKILRKFDLSKTHAQIDVLASKIANKPTQILRYSNLPYQALTLGTKELLLEPQIVPSYKQTDFQPAMEQDQQTADIPNIILQQAEELGYDPIKIYDFVNTQIDTEWYSGMMKGAAGTLAQKSANSVDQAALLIALFRASNVPARYVTGVIDLPIDNLTSMLGVENATQAVIALKRAGIAVKTQIEAGKIVSVHIEHTWVSALVPYANYRGATVDNSGQAWLPLMPAIKGYLYEPSSNILQTIGLDAQQIQSQYLNAIQTQDVLAQIQNNVNQYLANASNDQQFGQSYEDQLGSHQIQATSAGYLPNSLPVDVVAVTNEQANLPESLVHKVRFYARNGVRELDEIVLDVTVPLHQVASKEVSLSYQPATYEDQKLALSQGGIQGVPLYLINLRPQIKVQGRAIDVADASIAAGQLHGLYIDLISTSGTYSISKSVFAGSYHSIGIAAQQAVLSDENGEEVSSNETSGGKILSQIALRYIDQWTESENELALIGNRSLVRPLATVVFAGNDVDIEYLLGEPQAFVWKGVNLDAAFRVTESLPAQPSAISEQAFMKLAGLQGSYLEHKTFEQYFGVNSISADKGIALARQESIDVLEIDQSNIDTLLPQLQHNEAVEQDVQNWVDLGFKVTIPVTPIEYINWQGSVWLVEDLLTGQTGYFIARGLAGGASADEWPDGAGDFLENPYLHDIILEPSRASNVFFFPDSDFQKKKILEESDPLKVAVTDISGLPVKNAIVTFKVRSGAGTFVSAGGATDGLGKVNAVYKFPPKVTDSHSYSYIKVNDGDRYATQVGLNYVEVEVDRGAAGALVPSDVFTMITKPGDAIKIEQVPGPINTLTGQVERPLSFIPLLVTDENDNPVANVDVSVAADDISYSGRGYIKHNHKIKTPDCEGLVTIQSGCGAPQTTMTTDSKGLIRIGIIFGRVNKIIQDEDGNDVFTDSILGANYPITSTIPDGASVTLPFFTNSKSRFHWFMDDTLAAVEPAGVYKGKAEVEIIELEGDIVETFTPQEVKVLDLATQQKYGASFTGTQQLNITNMGTGSTPKRYNPYAKWLVERDNGTDPFIQESINPFPITVVDITPNTPDKIQLDADLTYGDFDDITYSAEPNDYEPFVAEMLLFKNGNLDSNWVANPIDGTNLMQGKAVLPPVQLDASAEYKAQIVFNRGSRNSEIRSEQFPIEVEAPVLRGAGGGGAIIYDSVNDESCVVAEPVMQIDLIQDANVTIVIGNTTIVSGQSFSKGVHQIKVNDFSLGKKKFTVTAISIADGNQDSKSGVFSVSFSDIGNLPVGSPSYENVNLFKGNLSFSRTDVQVPGRGAEIEFNRFYSSHATSDSSMGPGWSHNYDSFAQENKCGWVVVSGGVAGGVTFFPRGDGTFKPGKGYHSNLARNVEEGGWDFYSKDGTRYHYSRVFSINFAPISENPRYYLEYIQDTNGNVTSLGYSPSAQRFPQLEVIQDSSGREIRLEYATLFEMQEDQIGDVPTPSYLLYQAPRNLISKVTGVGYEIEYQYEQYGRLAKVINRETTGTVSTQNSGSGGITEDTGISLGSQGEILEQYEYDEPIATKLEEGNTLDGTEDVAMRKLIDYRGIETEYNYIKFDFELQTLDRLPSGDVLLNVSLPTMMVESFTKIDSTSGVAPARDISASFVYSDRSSFNEQVTVDITDPRDVNYTYTMDDLGRALSIDGPTGIKEMTWTPDDTLMLTSKDENGIETEYEYDEHGNVTREEVGGLEIISTYTTRKDGTIINLLQSREDRRGNTTNYDYDSNGNLTRITHPGSAACPSPCTERFQYYPNGDLSNAFDERSKRTSYVYDEYGNATTINYPIGTKRNKFDERSRKTRETDENNNVTRYEYDWLNRLVKQTNAEGGVRTFEYDENSNKIRETDEEERYQEWEYDFDNRVVEMSIFSIEGLQSISKTMAYDENDNLIEESDYRGNKTAYVYDDANRLTRTTYPANEQGKVRMVQLQYDDTDNITKQTVSNSGSSIQQITDYQYDDLYRKTQVTDAENGISKYKYDGNDNVTEKTDELGRIMQYQYDSMNRKTRQDDAVGSPVTRSMQWEYDRAGNLTRYIDGRGNDEINAYDDRNRRIQNINFEDNRYTYEYDDYGNVTAEIDHFNNRIEYQYDELHRRIKTTDQRDFDTEYVYDKVGNVLIEKWPNGNEITRQYDFLNRLINEQDDIGAIGIYAYDDDSNQISATNGRGHTTNYQYDALKQLTREDQPENRTLLIEYDVFGNVSKSTDGEGNETDYFYDRLNRLVRELDEFNNDIDYVYDAVDNRLEQTDKRGNTTQWEYDALNRVTKITEPAIAGHDDIIRNEYDKNDNLVKTTDKRRIVTQTIYDKQNRIIEQKRSNITILKNTWSEINNLIGVEDANGNKTAMEYNGRHEMVLQSRPELAITRYTYDSMGDMLTEQDPEGRVMSYQYDERRRIAQQTNGASETTEFEYDLNNNRTRLIKPEQNAWGYQYDELNRLVLITDADSKTSSYIYDEENNLLSQTDANSNTTEYEYDALNRRTLKRYPQVGGSQAEYSYTYDPNSNLATQTDPNGQVKTYSYDVLDRLSTVSYSNPASSTGRDLQSEQVSYDGNNNKLEVIETYNAETRTNAYVYDDFDRLYSHTDTFGKVLGYRYDLNGNRTQLIDSDGNTTIYEYDGLNRVSRVRTTLGLTRYDYDRSSLLTEVSYPNNTTSNYTYDLAKRTLRIHNQQNAATVSNYEYQYDLNGNRTEQKETNGGAEETTTYQYDVNDRLQQVAYPDKTTTYTYDANYNRLSETETDVSSATITNKTYAYNSRNQLTNVTDNLDANNNVSYQFDANGNQTQKTKGTEQTDFVYDIRDDLRTVQTGGSTVGQFLYDYKGLRIEKLGERGTERSTYDDQSVLQQYDENNLTRAKFDYGPDRLLSLKSQGEPAQFYLCDALRSVVNLTNSDGAVQARYQYDAWGNKRNEAGTSYNRFSFTGYEEDKETGLLYAKARFYDPDTGRFLGEDAWEGDNTIPPSLHKYLYVYANPTRYIDQTGLKPEDFHQAGTEAIQEGKHFKAAVIATGEAFREVADGITFGSISAAENQEGKSGGEAIGGFVGEQADAATEFFKDAAKEGLVEGAVVVGTKFACSKARVVCDKAAEYSDKVVDKVGDAYNKVKDKFSKKKNDELGTESDSNIGTDKKSPDKQHHTDTKEGDKITGPKGGVATDTGKVDANGNKIYQRESGDYYTIDKNGKQQRANSPNEHGNVAGDQSAECYNLTCRRTGEVKKIGETTRGEDAFGKGNQKRYSKEELKEKDVRYKKVASGTKKEMKELETEQIKEYEAEHGSKPEYNKTYH